MQELTQVETGARVRALRESAGLSRDRLAVQANVAVRTLVRVEQGEDTSIGTLRRIAGALGVSVAELLAEVAA